MTLRLAYENIFSRMIVCGDCGTIYGPVVWHSNDKYRRVVWRCANKFENEVKCETTHLTEEIMREKFVEMLGIYFADRKGILDSLRYVQRNLTDASAIDEDIADTEREMDMLAEMLHQTVMMNASASVSEEEYRHRYNDLTERFKAEEEKHAQLVAEHNRMEEESIAIGGMMFELTELDGMPIEFDEKLWFATVDHVTVYGDDTLVYSLRDGTEVKVEL